MQTRPPMGRTKRSAIGGLVTPRSYQHNSEYEKGKEIRTRGKKQKMDMVKIDV